MVYKSDIYIIVPRKARSEDQQGVLLGVANYNEFFLFLFMIVSRLGLVKMVCVFFQAGSK